MQGSWQRIARNAFGCSGPADFRPLRLQKYLKTKFVSSQCRHAHASAAAHSSGSSSFCDAEELSTAPTLDHLERPLSHSRVALEAAKAIRLAVSQGNLLDAYHILNSVHYAKRRSSPSGRMDSLLSLLPSNVFTPEAIPFHPQTPTRLVTHSLLHNLVRYGYLPEAARLSEELMKNNVKVHWASLDAVFNAVTDPSIPSDSPPGSAPPDRFTDKHTILSTGPIPESYINHEGGAYALSLLNVARRSRQRRTRGMFKALIALCIINGEIIVASLIFGLMVKDWNARVLELAGTQEDPPPRPKNCGPQELASRAILIRHQRTTPWPSENRLEEILTQIDEILRIRDRTTRPHIPAALQALANLAVLLDQRLIPFESVGSLIRMLTRAQTCHGSVQVPNEGGEIETVEAHAFFRSVLLRLALNPPRIASRRHATIQPPDPRNEGFLPALDANSYNHLLRFALDYEESRKIAERVVSHMTTEREPPLRPPKSVIERFRQGAVRLGSESLWERAAKLEKRAVPSKQTQVNRRKTPLPRRYAQLLTLRDASARETMARIDFLTRSGNVTELEDYFKSGALPGYALRLRPSKNGFIEMDDEAENDLRMAIARGPRVIVSVLSALAKVHRAHTAQRVWYYAKAVEAFSWTTVPDPSRGVLPWTLPIAAYSVMLGIHANEMKKKEAPLKPQKDRRGQEKQYGPVPLVCEQWSNGRKIYFGKKVVKRGAKIAKKFALQIYKSARVAYDQYAPMADKILSSTRLIGSPPYAQDDPYRGLLHPDHELPAPDSIFYNAMLEIVEPAGHAPKSKSLEEVTNQLREAEHSYQMSGVAPEEISEELIMVAKDMLDGGFPIPPGLRPHFVGSRLKHDANDSKDEPELWKSMYRLWVARKVKLRRRRDRARGLRPRKSSGLWRERSPRSTKSRT
ncbi:hypothetical protein MD484_g2200, partial [Candolleomyces efflorescens]